MPRKIDYNLGHIVKAINKLTEQIALLAENTKGNALLAKEDVGKSTTGFQLPPKEESKIEKPPSVPAPSAIATPIPSEYRTAVNEILNQSFGINIEPMVDQPRFMLTINVPHKYSNLTTREKEMGVSDLRSKVLTYAEGTYGVRGWAEQIYRNFDPTVQAQIVADRLPV